jgi:uncharacterized RDD family membrane protein YckC
MEQRVGFGKRLGAYLIDCVLVIIAAVVLGPIIGGMFGAAAGGAMSGALGGMSADSASAAAAMLTGGIVGAVLGALVAMAVIGLVYFIVEGFTGWTFGKLMLGIQVANADGTRASIGTLMFRYALKNSNFVLRIVALTTSVAFFNTLGTLCGLAVFVGCFFVLGTAHQAFHDMIAKTAVYPRSAVRAA